MALFHRLSHDPGECSNALALCSRPVIIDLETTGVARHNRIVSAGVLVDDTVFILFTGSHEVSVVRHLITLADLREALQPLQRPDLTAVFHFAPFDVGVLERADIPVRCTIHDTAKLLKLLDPDRGGKADARFDRRYRQRLNYRLKDVILHELDIRAPHFPGRAASLPYDRHVDYLTSDLLITRELHRHLQRWLRPQDWDYYRRLVAPITPILTAMTEAGVRPDPEFIVAESDHLERLLGEISATHEQRYGQQLDVGDYYLRGWVYRRLGCPVLRQVKSPRGWVPSLEGKVLARLQRQTDDPIIRDSLALIRDYFLARSLMVRLRAITKPGRIDNRSGRIHSRFNDWQASGRISSKNPNLQQIAATVAPGGRKEFVSEPFHDTVIKSRNAIIASPGHELVAMDIAQADVRCLAHAVDSFPHTSREYLEQLQQARLRKLRGIRLYRQRMWDYFQPENRAKLKCPQCWHKFHDERKTKSPMVRCPECGFEFEVPSRFPDFDPQRPCGLAADFRRGGSDFYTTATKRMLGRPPKDKTERNFFKQTILGIVNGMSARGLAARLDCPLDQARDCLEKFTEAYPEVIAFTNMMYHAAAITGYAETFGGRRRRITPHWWMVSRPMVELFVSYRRADKLWVKVIPLRPSRHTLTCWVVSVVDAGYDSPRRGQEIYHHKAGRISQAPYRFFEDQKLVFRLPVRNISWRLVRRVRTPKEETRYEGFDRVRRSLFNHICQGATADVARIMMMRAQPVCEAFNAQIVLQIHDEVVFDVPKPTGRFIRAMKKVLERSPTPDFRVPIIVEPKIGTRFGDLRELHPAEWSDWWIVRAWHWIWTKLKGLL